MREEKLVRWGIMGTGWVAQRFLADLAGIPHTEISAVASKTKSRAIEIGNRFNVKRAHSSYEDLTRDENVDVIYVATGPHQHMDHCLLALNEGKHVLCEKPFATTRHEAEKVVDAAQSKRMFCMEAMWSRFLPGMLDTRRMIDSGKIGNPMLVSADFGLPVGGNASRFFDPQQGGGALLDRGVYPIALATSLFGKPTKITSTASMHELGADKTVAAILSFRDNRLATIAASLDVCSSNRATISGTKGRITLCEPFYRPERVVVTDAPTSSETRSDLLPRQPKERIRRLLAKARPYLPFHLKRSSTSYYPVSGYGYKYEIMEVTRCILEGLQESPIMPLRDSLIVMEVVDTIREQISAIETK